jgi:hypothetical protein
MSNELIAIEKLNALDVFQNNGLEPVLNQIAERARTIVYDLDTDKGRKEIASMAYAVARSKTAIDDIGKDLVADWKEKAKKVDNERKRARDFLDALKDEIRQPLTQWEGRVAEHEEKIAQIRGLLTFDHDPTADDINQRIARAHEIHDRKWEEFADNAKAVYDMVLEDLQQRFDRRVKYEAEQAELENLRKEKEERERSAQLEKAKEEGAAEERRKAEQQKAAEDAEAKRREADREHKAKINRAALKAIMAEGVTEDMGMKILTAIVKGKVPNVSIRY